MLRVGGPRPADQMFLPSYYIWIPQVSDFTFLLNHSPLKLHDWLLRLTLQHIQLPEQQPLVSHRSPRAALVLLGSRELHRSMLNCNQIPLEMPAGIFINIGASSC